MAAGVGGGITYIVRARKVVVAVPIDNAATWNWTVFAFIAYTSVRIAGIVVITICVIMTARGVPFVPAIVGLHIAAIPSANFVVIAVARIVTAPGDGLILTTLFSIAHVFRTHIPVVALAHVFTTIGFGGMNATVLVIAGIGRAQMCIITLRRTFAAIRLVAVYALILNTEIVRARMRIVTVAGRVATVGVPVIWKLTLVVHAFIIRTGISVIAITRPIATVVPELVLARVADTGVGRTVDIVVTLRGIIAAAQDVCVIALVIGLAIVIRANVFIIAIVIARAAIRDRIVLADVAQANIFRASERISALRVVIAAI